MTRVLVGWASLAGQRPENQDCVLVDGMLSIGDVHHSTNVSTHERPVIVAAFDGMGGHSGGGVASRLAAALLGNAPPITDNAQLSERLQRCHRSISSVGGVLPGLAGMGTTVVGFHIDDDAYCVFHMGDSRAFRLVDGFVGSLTEADRAANPRVPGGHLLTHCLGVGAEPQPTVETYPLRRAIRLMGCTDGVADLMEPSAMADALRLDSPKQAALRLVQQALEAGSRDNVTAIVVDADPESSPTSDGGERGLSGPSTP